MRSIEDLEFLPAKRLPLMGILLLLIALAWLAWQAFQLRVATQERDKASATSNIPISGTHSRAGATTREDSKALALAVSTSKQLATPWSTLLQSLETATGSDVALLKIEPNALEGQLRITGEARNASAMLNYLQRVQATGALSQISLQSHQTVSEKPGTPTRFVFIGPWGSARANNPRSGV
jgi:Fimbrial assembly protein (PilN)